MNSTTAEDKLLAVVREYEAALESGRPVDREAFLEQHNDLPELGGYLEALEALHVRTPASSSPQVEALGDFRILREIGRGGMGIVYEAEQLSLGRKVALKVLPFAAAFDSRQLARFHNEARAAAQLHHSHIVPVFAVGCDRGVHYYAMQLIQGQTLAEWISGLREQARSRNNETTQARATTSRTLESGTTEHADRQVAAWMVQAARALEHAHAHGIVHRDIKPANLMLDGRGHLWVTDFGLAMLQSGVELTMTGDLLGTLRYMSPEQASGQKLPLDHRTDVYSLGATFYEFLTLTPVFPGTNRSELLQQIAQDEPKPPRQIRRSIPEELEIILLKCLNKSAGERYLSAGELAEDLERFLGHRPILARRPSLFERVRKWSRRHPSVVVTGLLLLVFATVGLVINHALVTREQARTRQALEDARIRADEAERRLQHTRQLVELLIQIGEEELEDKPHFHGVRKRLLESAHGHYQKLIDDTQDDPAVLADLAAARERVQQVLADLRTLQWNDQVMLLSMEAVVDELRPTETQREQLKELTNKLQRERMDVLFDQELSSSAKKKKQLEQARASDQALSQILGVTQRKRLGQLALQFQGVYVFRDSDVVRALGLTPGQRQRLREIEGEYTGQGPGPGFGKPPHWARHREGIERCLALLTPEQKETWRTLVGAPFTFPSPPMPPRPFGGRPPPPHDRKYP